MLLVQLVLTEETALTVRLARQVLLGLKVYKANEALQEHLVRKVFLVLQDRQDLKEI